MGFPAVIERRYRFTVLVLVLMAFGGRAGAETAWVTDMLQLGVHRAPDTSDTAFTFLKSADSLEILEQNLYYARVRLNDGREGWVRTTFLVDEPPPRLRVETVEKERDRTASELKSLQGKYSQQRSKLNELEKKISSDQAEVRSEQEVLEKLRVANAELNERLEAYRFNLPMVWALIGIMISLVAGFFTGWWWIDSRSRMRHGGFRIY